MTRIDKLIEIVQRKYPFIVGYETRVYPKVTGGYTSMIRLIISQSIYCEFFNKQSTYSISTLPRASRGMGGLYRTDEDFKVLRYVWTIHSCLSVDEDIFYKQFKVVI